MPRGPERGSFAKIQIMHRGTRVKRRISMAMSKKQLARKAKAKKAEEEKLSSAASSGDEAAKARLERMQKKKK